MRILVVNDDGVNSPKLETLVKVAKNYGLVYVSAPIEHQSATSHSISIGSRIEVDKTRHISNSEKTIAIGGYPADTVRLGLKIFEMEFDVVLAGVNDGFNLASDVIYSGTVAAAREAVILGVPGIAISADVGEDRFLEQKLTMVLDELVSSEKYKEYPLLNVNLPTQENVKGIRYTTMGRRLHQAEFNELPDSNNYKISYSLMLYDEDNYTDSVAVDNGYISITPLKIDQTSEEGLKELRKKLK